MADKLPTPNPLIFARAGALRPCLVPQFTAIAMAVPVVGVAGSVNAWIPVIHYPERMACRWYRYPRKPRLTAVEALRYAEHAIHYLQVRMMARRRRQELREDSYPIGEAA